MPYSMNWNLDKVFPGGSTSPELHSFLKELKEEIYSLENLARDSLQLSQCLKGIQVVGSKMKQVGAFVACLCAQNVEDKNATQLSADLTDLGALLQNVSLLLDQHLSLLDDSSFERLINQPEFSSIAFPLRERRRLFREKMDFEKESLANMLAIDGFHGWEQFYDVLVGQMKIPMMKEGKLQSLSVGQAHNLLSHSDRNVRQEAFRSWKKAWDDGKELSAQTLNHLAGFRLKLYEKRGWENVLKAPLDANRMTQKTLDVMWSVINANKKPFVEYCKTKAKHLRLDQLDWHDVYAPWGKVNEKISYQEAADFIVQTFDQVSPKMSDYAKKAFSESWIEAEDRFGKQPGGFCTGLPLTKESRIFMTYSGTPDNVATLAHELGHGYHNALIQEVPIMAQRYPMSLAETASTFAEQVVSSEHVKKAKDEEEKLSLYADRVQRSIVFFFNIQARYLFELSFYGTRKNGFLSSDTLCQLMEEAQREVFDDVLKEYDPYFWASKMHFYITSLPFYNFPYTVGYLFSLGLYARAIKDPENFPKAYDAFLQDTGRMTVEELANIHFNVDLTLPQFWQDAMDVAIEDVKAFNQLFNKTHPH